MPTGRDKGENVGQPTRMQKLDYTFHDNPRIRPLVMREMVVTLVP
jgi:hypothetical protein